MGHGKGETILISYGAQSYEMMRMINISYSMKYVNGKLRNNLINPGKTFGNNVICITTNLF